jgi:hypothetical protein
MAAPTVGLHLNFRGYVTEFSARNPHSFFGETPTRLSARIDQSGPSVTKPAVPTRPSGHRFFPTAIKGFPAGRGGRTPASCRWDWLRPQFCWWRPGSSRRSFRYPQLTHNLGASYERGSSRPGDPVYLPCPMGSRPRPPCPERSHRSDPSRTSRYFSHTCVLVSPIRSQPHADRHSPANPQSCLHMRQGHS